MLKYLRILRVSLFGSSELFGNLLIRALFFLVIIYIFSCIWTLTSSTDNSLRKEQLIWYLTATELIIISIPLIQFEIENDVRSGDFIYLLTKPVHYMGLRITEGIGVLLFRLSFLVPLGVIYAYFLSGGWTPTWTQFLLGFFLIFLACLGFLISHASLGVLAFSLEDTSPLFWIWQRSSFLFGGLIIPIDFYPEWLQKFACWTPFWALLYAPSRYLIGGRSFFETLLPILFWMSCALVILVFLYRRELKGVTVHGG